MQSPVNKTQENVADRMVEVFWVAVKAAVVTAIVLVLLRIIPVTIQHEGSVSVVQGRGSWSVDVSR